MTIGPTRSTTKQQESAEIERQIQEFLERGGKIDNADLRKTKQVDLTWRNYAETAMGDKHGEAN